jgi:hypothetical protein
MELILDDQDIKIFRIKPCRALKTNMELFLAKTMSYAIHTLCKNANINGRSLTKFAVAIRITIATNEEEEIRYFDSEYCLYNNGEDVLTDCFGLNRELDSKVQDYLHDIHDSLVEILEYHLIISYKQNEHEINTSCEGCRINHPSQLQHMGVNGCLTML